MRFCVRIVLEGDDILEQKINNAMATDIGFLLGPATNFIDHLKEVLDISPDDGISILGYTEINAEENDGMPE